MGDGANGRKGETIHPGSFRPHYRGKRKVNAHPLVASEEDAARVAIGTRTVRSLPSLGMGNVHLRTAPARQSSSGGEATVLRLTMALETRPRGSTAALTVTSPSRLGCSSEAHVTQ